MTSFSFPWFRVKPEEVVWVDNYSPLSFWLFFSSVFLPPLPDGCPPDLLILSSQLPFVPPFPFAFGLRVVFSPSLVFAIGTCPLEFLAFFIGGHPCPLTVRPFESGRQLYRHVTPFLGFPFLWPWVFASFSIFLAFSLFASVCFRSGRCSFSPDFLFPLLCALASLFFLSSP